MANQGASASTIRFPLPTIEPTASEYNELAQGHNALLNGIATPRDLCASRSPFERPAAAYVQLAVSSDTELQRRFIR